MFMPHSKNNLEYIHFDFLIGGSSKKTTLCLLNYVIKIVHFHELRDQDVDMHHALMRLYIF